MGDVYVSAILSATHVLAFGLGLGSLYVRGRGFRAIARGGDAVSWTLSADNYWGLAALLWIATGVTRLFGEYEKTLRFYTYNGWFWTKLALFGVVFTLELWPMITLIRWRIAEPRGQPLDTSRVRLFARFNDLELATLPLIAASAALMARGAWLFP